MPVAMTMLLNLASALYNVGTICAHEVDIFRSWKLIDPKNFPAVQSWHWNNSDTGFSLQSASHLPALSYSSGTTCQDRHHGRYGGMSAVNCSRSC